MIKNRTTQLIFQTTYCVLGIIGLIGSLGYFNKSFNSNFYVYYTNLSNYICLGVMIASLIETARCANKKQDGYVSIAPTFKFLCVIMILVTFLVYNILLAGEKSASSYFLSFDNLLLHLILPIMFVLDWVLFYEHEKLKWYHPLLSTVMPLIYVVLIMIRALIIGASTDALLYPYFFLNVDKLGWGGMIVWVLILLAVFVAIGYLFYLFDNIKKIKNRKIKNNKE